MTIEKAIDRLRKISEKTPIRTNGDDLVAITMAIQALSQEPTNEKELNKAYTFGHNRGVKAYYNEQLCTVELPEAVFRYILSLVPTEEAEQEPCDDAISRKAVFNAIEREDKWLLAAKGHNGLTEMAFSGLKARIDALLPVTQKSVLEQITAEIYEHFMTIDGGVHDKSAIKCMEIIGKYKGDKE